MAPKGRQLADRETTIYGVTIDLDTGDHYCFNRDYLVLTQRLSAKELDALQGDDSFRRQGVAHGHGRNRPSLSGSRYVTIFLFSDANSPRWRKASLKYDRSAYL